MPLENRTIRCPKCGQLTELAIATPREAGTAFSSSSCRKCLTLFVCLTLDDGNALVFDGEGVSPPEGQFPQPLCVIPPSSAQALCERVPRHLGVFDRGTGFEQENLPPGISDDDLAKTLSVELDRILRSPDGSKRDPEQAAKVLGWRSVWMAQFTEAIRERLAGPPPLTYPPAIFISYRWAANEENQWVAELAAELRARGYPVMFDREMPGELSVPQRVSRIADARVFIAVLDPGYAERIGGTGAGRILDGWVYDEQQTALRFSNAGDLEVIGLLRQGKDLPTSFHMPSPGRRGNTCDVRQAGQLTAVLNRLFPKIKDLPSENTLVEARALLAKSHDYLRAGRYREALQSAARLTSLLPNTVDGPVQMVRVARRAEWHDAALDASERALMLAPEHPELLVAAGSAAANKGDPHRAIRYLGRFLETRPESSDLMTAQARLAIGSCLDDVHQVFPAIAHCEVARNATGADPNLCVTLAYLYRRINNPRRALEAAEEGLKMAPEHIGLLLHAVCANFECGRTSEAKSALLKLKSVSTDSDQVAYLTRLLESPPGPLIKPVELLRNPLWVTCSKCPARVPARSLSASICCRCGSVLEGGGRECPNCSSTGRLALTMLSEDQWECPYCRTGLLKLGQGS
jgi:tetratricopeptide (TPR) repeat protein